MICGVCNREWADVNIKVLTLTAQEKENVSKLTNAPAPDTFVYCTPCWKLLHTREQEAQFIANTMRAHLRSKRHPKADKVAEKMLHFLLSKSGKPVS